jgi:hypothetical protein
MIMCLREWILSGFHWLDLLDHVRESWIIFSPKLTLQTGYPKQLGSTVLVNKIPAVLI